jgi:hypothetical protein
MRAKPAISTSTIPAAAKIQTGIPAGPVFGDGEGGVAGISGNVAPQTVQNFWAENSRAAPHIGQNRGGIVVRGGLPSG